MIKVKCTKPVSFGLFRIEPESVWILDGVKYDSVPKRAMMRLSEYKADGLWVEIPQEIFAFNFDKVEEFTV